MIKLRDLFVRIGFQADAKPLRDIDSGIRKLKSTVKSLTYAIMGSAGLAAGFGYLLKQAGYYEQVTVSFETMLGSAEKAQEMLENLREFTMRTPFELKDLLSNTKMLLGMGIAADDIIETLEHLGNVSAGLSVPIERLALNYGQVLAQSKLTLREVRDFAFAGVPILQVLSMQLKKTIPEIQQLIQAGKVTFDQTKEAFKYMATEGRFADLMIKQSKTLFGLFSIAKDFIFLTAVDIGTELLPAAKKVISAFIQWAKVNKEFLKNNIANNIKTLSKGIWGLFKFTRWLVNEIGILIHDLGGLEIVMKTLISLFAIFIGYQLLSGIGNIASGVFTLTSGFLKLGAAAKAARAWLYLEPLLIGAAFLLVLGLIQDIYGYLTGKDSLTGLLNDILREKFPNVANALELAFGTIGEVIKATIKSVVLLAKLLGNIITLNYSDFNKNLAELKTTWPEAFANIRTVSEQNLGSGHKQEFVDPSMVTGRPLLPGWIEKKPSVLNAPITINVEGGHGDDAEYISWRVREEIEGVVERAGAATTSQEVK